MGRLRARWAVLALILGLCGTPARGQTQEYKLYTDHPRLLLGAQRLRLLRRERERQSPRWRQFQTLIAGKARMTEPGLAWALYYQVAGDADTGRRAVEWALGPTADLRQTALVFDWCQPLLDDRQSAALAGKLSKQLEAGRGSLAVPEVRSRALAAIAVSGHVQGLPEEQLKWTVEVWWRARPALARDTDYPLFEMMHALRDNLEIDFQEDRRAFFDALPQEHLLEYYPAIYPAPENDYQIPCFAGGEPNLDRAALYRAAELAMIAYNTNAVEYQYLQGWLMRDRFSLRSPFGAPYEFLWANPYQPGLSYRNLPLVFHDPANGRTYARADWSDGARWLGYFDGRLQIFEDGEIKPVDLRKSRSGVRVGSVVVIPGANPFRCRLDFADGGRMFIVGLKPDRSYDVEIDDQEMREEKTDRGGVLSLEFLPDTRAGFRMRETGSVVSR